MPVVETSAGSIMYSDLGGDGLVLAFPQVAGRARPTARHRSTDESANVSEAATPISPTTSRSPS